jgi:hypothetical protein
LLRVLLDGGPTRGFSANDSAMLEEDVNVLKVCVEYELRSVSGATSCFNGW